MARATHLTISTADRIRLDGRCGEENEDGREDGENEVRQEVQVSVTYALDPGDTNLVLLAERKALEVTLAHEAAWNRIGAFRGGGRNHGGGAGPGHRLAPHAADQDRVNEEDENDDPDDGGDDDPLAGLPHRGNDPFGGGPVPAGAARPFPTPTTGRESHTDRLAPVPRVGREPDPALDAEPLTGPQKILIRSRARKAGLTPYALETLLFQHFKVWKVEKLSRAQATSVLDALERDLREKERKTEAREEWEGGGPPCRPQRPRRHRLTREPAARSPRTGYREDEPHSPPRWVSLDARLGRLVCAGLDLSAGQIVGRITRKRLVRVFADGHGDHDGEEDGALCASSDRRVADHGRPGRECNGCADRGACTPRWRILWKGCGKEEPDTGLTFAHTLSAADTVRLTRYALALRREGLRLPDVLTRISVEGVRQPGTGQVRWCLRFEKVGCKKADASG